MAGVICFNFLFLFSLSFSFFFSNHLSFSVYPPPLHLLLQYTYVGVVLYLTAFFFSKQVIASLYLIQMFTSCVYVYVLCLMCNMRVKCAHVGVYRNTKNHIHFLLYIMRTFIVCESSYSFFLSHSHTRTNAHALFFFITFAFQCQQIISQFHIARTRLFRFLFVFTVAYASNKQRICLA